MLNKMPFYCSANTQHLSKGTRTRNTTHLFLSTKAISILVCSGLLLYWSASICWDKMSDIHNLRKAEFNFIHGFRGSVHDWLVLKQKYGGNMEKICSLHSSQKSRAKGRSASARHTFQREAASGSPSHLGSTSSGYIPL